MTVQTAPRNTRITVARIRGVINGLNPVTLAISAFLIVACDAIQLGRAAGVIA